MLRSAIFIICLLNSASAYCAAWTQSQGAGQLIVGNGLYKSSKYYNSVGKVESSSTEFTKIEFNQFVEYGLFDDLTIGASPTLQKWYFEKNDISATIFDFRQCGVFSQLQATKINSSIIESEFFLRKKIYDDGKAVISFQPLIKTPCIQYNNGQFNLIENTTDYEIRLLGGYGFQWDPDISFTNMKRPFSGQYHFVNLEVAYRERSEKFADQIRVDATAGFRPYDDLLLLGQVFTKISTGKESVSGYVSNNQIVAEMDKYHSVKMQVSAVQQITKTKAIQFSIFREIMGKNSGMGDGLNISLWYGF